jgi:uncharacterized protein
MAKVFFLRAGGFTPEGYRRLLARFLDESPLGRTDIAAVKIHAGEQGNTRFLSPDRINSVVRGLGLPDGRTFLTDTTVLYRGRRLTAPDYMLLASGHGFGPPGTAPFIVADGLRGTDEILVKLPSCCDNPSARIARTICEADAMAVISHFKGHLLAGFGGALKNLGMGCASRGGKLFQHSSVKPVVRIAKCTACGACASHCPEEAITVSDCASISGARCVGCGECIARCPTGAVSVDWNQDQGIFTRRMAEYALAAFTVTRTFACINFVVDVVPDCDCLADSGEPVVEDIGVLASGDPVALDQACLDLVTAAPATGRSPVPGAGAGADKFRALRPSIDGSAQLAAAQSLGLGTRSYELEEVEG